MSSSVKSKSLDKVGSHSADIWCDRNCDAFYRNCNMWTFLSCRNCEGLLVLGFRNCDAGVAFARSTFVKGGIGICNDGLGPASSHLRWG